MNRLMMAMFAIVCCATSACALDGEEESDGMRNDCADANGIMGCGDPPPPPPPPTLAPGAPTVEKAAECDCCGCQDPGPKKLGGAAGIDPGRGLEEPNCPPDCMPTPKLAQKGGVETAGEPDRTPIVIPCLDGTAPVPEGGPNPCDPPEAAQQDQ